MSLTKKIDFVAFFTVNKANPNGDPLNGNRPRIDYEGFGEVSDVCIKRKIRNRWIDMGQEIFVQSDEKRVDDYRSLKERFEGYSEAQAEKDPDKIAKLACEKWLDIRGFGQVLAFKKKGDSTGKGVSIGVRGPVSIHTATSLEVVEISSMQITKSVNSEPTKNNEKSSDTMGTKHRIEFGTYKLCGSVNVQLAEKTGFSNEDAELLKKALCSLFENDASSARPEGSIEVNRVYWVEHDTKTGKISSASVHRGISAEIVDPQKRDFNRYTIKEDGFDGFERQQVNEQLVIYKA